MISNDEKVKAIITWNFYLFFNLASKQWTSKKRKVYYFNYTIPISIIAGYINVFSCKIFSIVNKFTPFLCNRVFFSPAFSLLVYVHMIDNNFTSHQPPQKERKGETLECKV